MSRCLSGRNESRPYPSPGRARRENGGEQAGRPDATRREDWDAHLIEDRVEEFEERQAPPYMPSCFRALGNDHVATGVLGSLRLDYRSDLPRR
jgi:hypothetical protein